MQASRQSAAVTPVKPKMGIQNKGLCPLFEYYSLFWSEYNTRNKYNSVEGVKKVVVTLEEIEKGVDINSFFDLEVKY